MSRPVRLPAEERETLPHALVRFVEYGPHKTIVVVDGPGSGTLRISDQATIDALREAFEKTGWAVADA